MARHPTGWHLLQLPGPTNVPRRVLQAIAEPTIDHRGPEFPKLTREISDGLRGVFRTRHDVVIYPSSASGAWEAALVNTLSTGDGVLIYETGHFAMEWAKVGERLGLDVDVLPGDWRRGADPDAIEERLKADREGRIKAVAVIHNETSTGAVSRIADVRAAIDAADHPALLLVDAVSSLGSLDYRHDDWGVDITIAGSQKGLMLPPGLAFLAIGPRALEAGKRARLPRSYWAWDRLLEANADGYFPYTPATNLLVGLREALRMLREEGLENVIRRQSRFGAAARAAVDAWGLELQCTEPREYSDVLTAVRLAGEHDANRLRKVILERYDLTLGSGLGRLKGRVFRIGHLGDLNDLMLIAALAGVESGLRLSNVPIQEGGVAAAMRVLETSA
ncbi:MAG: aminotransferase class V-fold PLP-dependent enzyme [Gemmatimonas sp.]|nr:aminotransferase class V-fold PLP-dependent enzyme [Gemmatimonas sp.]